MGPMGHITNLRRCLNVFIKTLHLSYSSPFVKRVWLFIKTNLNPLHPKMLCAKFGWNWPSGSGEDENVKSLRTDGQTDRHTTNDRWSENFTWAFSSGELIKSYCNKWATCLYQNIVFFNQSLTEARSPLYSRKCTLIP